MTSASIASPSGHGAFESISITPMRPCCDGRATETPPLPNSRSRSAGTSKLLLRLSTSLHWFGGTGPQYSTVDSVLTFFLTEDDVFFPLFLTTEAGMSFARSPSGKSSGAGKSSVQGKGSNSVCFTSPVLTNGTGLCLRV